MTKAFLTIVRKYFEQDPVAAAHVLETMEEEEAVEVLQSLSVSEASVALGNLNDVFASEVLQKLPPSLFRAIMDQMEPQQAATIFLQLPSESRQFFLEGLEEKRKRHIQEFLTYPEDSAGRIMSTQFLALHSDIKVQDAIQKIRLLAQKGASSSYVYVLDRDNYLVGVVNMRDMMLASSESLLETVMRKDVFTINCFLDRERIAEELSARKYFAAPVVDSENRMLGVIKAEQLIDDVQEEATEDIQKMFGAGGDERPFSPIMFSLKNRLPWLYVNLATAFLAAGVVSLFEGIIAKITVLAVYLPVVAGQGGNAGAQSLAIVMRGLVMREIPSKKAKHLVLKEASLGVINGLAIGVVTAGIAWLWQGNPYLGLVIGLGMLVNLTVAGLAGAVIPLSMKAIGLDPAQCSSIILTTITDVMGFFSFLGFAVIFQRFLI